MANPILFCFTPRAVFATPPIFFAIRNTGTLPILLSPQTALHSTRNEGWTAVSYRTEAPTAVCQQLSHRQMHSYIWNISEKLQLASIIRAFYIINSIWVKAFSWLERGN
jgi:hypothetical protein